jgi:hypothetical protein
MARINRPYGDNPEDASAMPHVMRIGVLNHCLPDQNVDGEMDDPLKPEIVKWLKINCAGRWRFMSRYGNPVVVLDEDGAGSTEISLDYFLRFTNLEDAFHWRLRWYNIPPETNA